MEQQREELSPLTEQTHQTLLFSGDPEVTQDQNFAEGGAGRENKDGEEGDLGFGSQDHEKAVFVPDRLEKSNLGEDDLQRDGDEFEVYGDEEVERMINEELKELVLCQAISEQKGSVDGEEGCKKVENNGWGEYEEEEYGELGNVEYGNGNQNENLAYGEVGDVGYGNENLGREEEKYNAKKMMYPLRPDAEDCAFYMRTGSCKFGFHCKFNHPPVPRRKYQAPKDKIKPREEQLERSGQTDCKYYLSSGGCKYGNACKFNHTRDRSTGSPASEFNFLGLPIRPGGDECPYYMRNGSCKYGSNCRFHHPDPTAGSGADPSVYGNGAPLPGASQSAPWSSPRALNNAASFMPMMYQPPVQGIPSNTDWNGYQPSVYSTTKRSLPAPPAFTMNNLGPDAIFPSRHHQPLFMDEFPERPGQPECSYFLKTGDCKYKSNCKFHHPKSKVMKSTSCTLSDKGLPLRPDQAVCSFYQRYGICKFGPACKFDHPENMGNSVHSSLSDFEHSSFNNAIA